MPIKSRVSFAVPKSLQDELRLKVITGGYGMRGKSLWVSEAVEQLLSIPKYPELVSFNDEMHGLNKVETISLDKKIQLDLEKAVLNVRKEYPTIEGVKSRIFRTAIVQRIIRGS